MNKNCMRGCLLSAVAGGLVMVSGCVIEPNGAVAFRPVVVVAPPPPVVVEPAVTVSVGVPDDYVWDGTEYVGLVGDQYYYLGPGDVWLLCDPVRLDRFHGWERGHPDWRSHAIRNDRFRRDAHGHEQARHDEHGH